MIEATETWRPVVGFEGYYEVSDHGAVRSLDRVLTHGRKRRGGILGQGTKKSGHAQVRLCKGGVHSWRGVHTLVLAAFVGPCPIGMEGAHNNGVPGDNRLGNLRWDTPKGNAADRKLHGTEMLGERNPRAKLTDLQVAEVFSLSASGAKGKDIAVAMQCTPANISAILRGKHRRAA